MSFILMINLTKCYHTHYAHIHNIIHSWLCLQPITSEIFIYFSLLFFFPYSLLRVVPRSNFLSFACQWYSMTWQCRVTIYRFRIVRVICRQAYNRHVTRVWRLSVCICCAFSCNQLQKKKGSRARLYSELN